MRGPILLIKMSSSPSLQASRGTIPREDCLKLEYSLRQEWLDTNGLGGYASSTIIGCHIRKYHGMLVAALPSHGGRFVLLSKFDDSIAFDNKELFLSTNKYPDVFSPTGHQYIESFTSLPYPQMVFRIGDVLMRKSFIMQEGSNTVLISYEVLEADHPFDLRLRPLLAYRSIHGLQKENMYTRVKMFGEGNQYKIEPYEGMPALHFQSNLKCDFYGGPCWYRNVEYLKERSRGYPYQEDLFCPGVFEKKIKPGQNFVMAVSCDGTLRSAEAAWNKELQRRTARMTRHPVGGIEKSLDLSAESFVINNALGQKSIVAGYPWFCEWGRDAMIAVPGLCFYRGALKEGFEVLKTFAGRAKEGWIPNYLSDDGQHDAFNSVDATLWFFWAVQQYLRRDGNVADVEKSLLPFMIESVSSVIEGRSPLLRLRDDGLVECGDENTQLTWMDARVHGVPVTPRHGMPVEINALWFNALCFTIELLSARKKTVPPAWAAAREKFIPAFVSNFWVEEGCYLADVVRDGFRDESVRPNQIFAASMPISPLTTVQMRGVVECVEKELLTPFGLRTLSPKHPHYRGFYTGRPEERDRSYHQGTVWPWLLGGYVDACLRSASNKTRKARQLHEILGPMIDQHIFDFGQGSIAEIFEGNPPHRPRGCIAQAWSVGEFVRATVMVQEASV